MDGQIVDKVIAAMRQPVAALSGVLGILIIFLIVLTVGELKGLRYIGAGIPATNTITVSGEGEVFAVPDIATFSVSVQEEAKEVQDAQEVATEKTNSIIAFLKGEGVEERDIKTTDYSVYPQYDYLQSVCSEGYCPPGRQELRGYQVSQTLTVKVRDTEEAGALLSGVGSRGASNVSGLTFTIDDEDALQTQARELAIADAQTKAEELADQLGVKIVRVTGFYENDYGYPTPYAYGLGGADTAIRAETIKVAPELPVGENKIVSNVNVTYEIR